MLPQFNWSEAIGSSFTFIALILCSVVMLGIAIERAYYFWKRGGNPDRTLTDVLRSLRSGDVKEATRECRNSRHPFGRVALQIFKCESRDRAVVEEQIQIALSQEKMLLEKNLAVLGTLAVAGPLMGLLGTVWGIMRAFGDMAITGSAATSIVASGVAEALITTAAGLIVAIPALMFYNHFTRRMNVMLTVAENGALGIRSALEEALSRGSRPAEGLEVPRDGGSSMNVIDTAETRREEARGRRPEPAPVR